KGRGSTIDPGQANYNGEPYAGGGSKGEWRKATMPGDSFAAHPWGFYNGHGNVWEWTEDCWTNPIAGKSGDGSARSSGDCTSRWARGGSWGSFSASLRSARREPYENRRQQTDVGFRLARTLNP